MAKNQNINGVSLSISLETNEFKAGLTEIKHQLDLTTNNVKAWKQSLKLNPNDTATLKTYGAAIEELRKQAIEARDKLQVMYKELIGSGVSPSDPRITALISQLKNLDNIINKAIPDYENFKFEIGSWEDSFNGASSGALELGDIIKANLLTDAIRWGFSELVDLTKQLASGYINLIKSGVQYNAQMEGYTVSIRAMAEANGETADSADKLVQSMKDIGKQSAFSNDTLLEASQQLLSADVNAEKTTKTIEGLAKALAYTGGGNDELKRMAQNLQQIKNVGKASSVDIKQFAYAGINVYGLLADQLGLTTDQVKEMDITFDMISEALIKASEEGGKFADTFQVQAGTLNGQLEMMKSNWQELAGLISQDATNSLTNDFLPAINETIIAMQEGFKEGGIDGLAAAFAEGISNLAPIVLEKAPELIQMGFDLINKVAEGLLQEDENGNTILENSVEELVTTLITLVGSEQFIKNLFAIGKAIGEGIVKGIKNALNAFADWFNNQWAVKYGDANFVSGSFFNSGGFGNIPQFQSGGFASGGITLNASFNVTGNTNFDEATALRFANMMADSINERLGEVS